MIRADEVTPEGDKHEKYQEQMILLELWIDGLLGDADRGGLWPVVVTDRSADRRYPEGVVADTVARYRRAGWRVTHGHGHDPELPGSRAAYVVTFHRPAVRPAEVRTPHDSGTLVVSAATGDERVAPTLDTVIATRERGEIRTPEASLIVRLCDAIALARDVLLDPRPAARQIVSDALATIVGERAAGTGDLDIGGIHDLAARIREAISR